MTTRMRHRLETRLEQGPDEDLNADIKVAITVLMVRSTSLHDRMRHWYILTVLNGGAALLLFLGGGLLLLLA